MTKEEFNNWVSAYIEAEDAPEKLNENNSLFWAVEQFMNLNYENPEICWEAILEILERNPSDKVIAVLAAGPLEDLIEVHGSLFIDRIEKEARRNPRFRHLLGGVWQSSTPEIWARVEKARIKAW